MKLRSPLQLALETLQCLAWQACASHPEQVLRNSADPLGLCGIWVEFARQALDAGGAQIGRVLFPVEQVIKNAVAQRTLGGFHLFNAQQSEHSPQHADAAANDGAPVILHAVEFHAVGMLRLEQAIEQPVEAITRDKAGRPTRGRQYIADGANRAGRTIGDIPDARLVGIDRFIKHRFGRNFSHLESARRELAVRKVLHGPGYATDAVGLHRACIEALAQDHFGGASADVDNQAALIRLGQQMGHTLVNQASFFAA